jgi:predicted RNase H-like HicB family nuclease
MSDQAAVTKPPVMAGEPAGTPNGDHAVTIEVQVKLQALAIPEPGGGYSVVVPALPGCVTDADTIEEAQANVVEAAELWLESQHEHRKAESLRVARGE